MLGFFGSGGTRHVVGIDIGMSSIKVVQLKLEKEKIYLETYGEVALGPYASLAPGEPTLLGDEKCLKQLPIF
jgi:Tfp pilus assembly PilM family ATPase